MNEININGLNRSAGIDKSYSSGNQKPVKRSVDEQDSVELSTIPNLSQIEAAIEEEFAAKRKRLEDSVSSEEYPALETIDKLAAMFAVNFDQQTGELDK
jgi:hypothetical protein